VKVARYVLKERGEEVTPPSTLTDKKTADDMIMIKSHKNGQSKKDKVQRNIKESSKVCRFAKHS
jgi:hypothetical protein